MRSLNGTHAPLESKHERVTSNCTGDSEMNANEKSGCPGSPQLATQRPDPCLAVPRGKLANYTLLRPLAWVGPWILG